MPEISELLAKIERLEEQLAIANAGSGKPSPCCNAPLVPFISFSKKRCADCDTWYDWNLDPGQKPLF